MKIVQWTLAAVGAVALAIVLCGVALPSKFSVTRSVTIAAPAERIYDLVVEPRQWAKWSAWQQRDPGMRVTYAGPPFGLGAKWSWESGKEGSGSMEFTRVVPDRLVAYSLVFADFGMRSAGAFTLEPEASGTRVTWTNAGDMGGNPLKHYVAAAMDHMVGPDFERGLANLKALAEKP